MMLRRHFAEQGDIKNMTPTWNSHDCTWPTQPFCASLSSLHRLDHVSRNTKTHRSRQRWRVFITLFIVVYHELAVPPNIYIALNGVLKARYVYIKKKKTFKSTAFSCLVLSRFHFVRCLFTLIQTFGVRVLWILREKLSLRTQLESFLEYQIFSMR